MPGLLTPLCARAVAVRPWPIVVPLVALGLLVGAAPAAAETTISLTFDDGSGDQMAAEQILADHRLRGTFFVIPGRIGTTSRYMTWADVAAVYATGNEIGGHTLTHRDLTTLPSDEQREEICGARQDLLARGYPPAELRLPLRTPRSDQRGTRRGMRLPVGPSVRRAGGVSRGIHSTAEPLGDTHPQQRQRG
jgi:peptidoglycan/xylan/chitin deacetylase (PgdA/CDA1 family)